MKRIDTINARENLFGIGKSGFHDNADLPGQDATYVSPEWFNMIQEELCNLLELRGIALNSASKQQLYELLTTQTDLEALADAIEANFIRKNQIIDNLTTDDATKPISAKQAKLLQDNKLDKTANAVSATKLQTARTIAGVSFDGTANIDLPLVGIGQIWRDVSSSRISGTTYTNTSSKPLCVCISPQNSSNTTSTLTVNGFVLCRARATNIVGENTMFAIVPPGGTYSAYFVNSNTTWHELST